jgi:hypothetical protein
MSLKKMVGMKMAHLLFEDTLYVPVEHPVMAIAVDE